MLSRNSNGYGHRKVGFRLFRSLDEELVNILSDVVLGPDSLVQEEEDNTLMLAGDIFSRGPWELSKLYDREPGDPAWYFLCQPNYKYSNSKRVNRTTKAGFWKATGKPLKIKASGTKEVIGIKKTLVFYLGSVRGRNWKWSPWVLNEYELPATLPNQKISLFLYKLKKKEGDERVDISRNEESLEGQSSDDWSPNSATDQVAADQAIPEKTEQQVASSNNSLYCNGFRSSEFPDYYPDYGASSSNSPSSATDLVAADHAIPEKTEQQVASSNNSPYFNGFRGSEVTDYCYPYNGGIHQQNDEFCCTADMVARFMLDPINPEESSN